MACRLTFALLIVLLVSPAFADITGKARVIDGDTIEIAGKRIRLHGIDAPESHQSCRVDGKEWPCGFEATNALAFDLAEHWVTCEAVDRDRYGRIAATCKIGPYDVGARMVRAGWALAYRRYSNAYVDDEEAAIEAGVGIWRGDFVSPEDWRRGRRLATRAVGTCRIKGNISRNGERIYHMPEGLYYARTHINPSKGERWFCTEEDAVKAGWRPSRR